MTEMDIQWLNRNDGSKLILVCNGWGMDAGIFAPLDPEEHTLLILSRFSTETSIPDGLLDDILRHKERILVSWSMGVWWGQKLFAGTVAFDRAVAVNGTLCPIHDSQGIPRDLVEATMNNWSTDSRNRFYRRMCKGKEVLATFMSHAPQRSVPDQVGELAMYLEHADCISRSETIYREVIVSRHDMVVPAANQYRFWGEHNLTTIPGGHLPFYGWNNWGNLLADIQGRLSGEGNGA